MIWKDTQIVLVINSWTSQPDPPSSSHCGQVGTKPRLGEHQFSQGRRSPQGAGRGTGGAPIPSFSFEILQSGESFFYLSGRKGAMGLQLAVLIPPGRKQSPRKTVSLATHPSSTFSRFTCSLFNTCQRAVALKYRLIHFICFHQNLQKPSCSLQT